jgi:hypothetical protein
MVQVAAFQVVATCSVAVGYQRFGGRCCFHRREDLISHHGECLFGKKVEGGPYFEGRSPAFAFERLRKTTELLRTSLRLMKIRTANLSDSPQLFQPVRPGLWKSQWCLSNLLVET